MFPEHLDNITNRFTGCLVIMLDKGDLIVKQAAKAAEQFDYVIAAGGDGTAQQVAKGVLGTDAILGVLPMGSGNDFAKSLGMDKPFEQALDVLKRADINRIDVVQTGSDIFLNIFGVGIDGLTNYYAAGSPLKSASLRYFVSAVKALLQADRFEYECIIDGDRLAGKSSMIVVANGPTEGGRYKISPRSCNTDGILEVIIVRDVPLSRIVPEFLKLSAGIPFDEEIAIKRTCRDSLSITLDRSCYAHADGEIVQPATEFCFRIKKQVLPVITGARSCAS